MALPTPPMPAGQGELPPPPTGGGLPPAPTDNSADLKMLEELLVKLKDDPALPGILEKALLGGKKPSGDGMPPPMPGKGPELPPPPM